MEIWCNESQVFSLCSYFYFIFLSFSTSFALKERYVLAVNANQIETFEAIAHRERCPFAEVGVATNENQLILTDKKFSNRPIDLSMGLLFGKVGVELSAL